MADEIREPPRASKLAEAWKRFDEINAKDPNCESDGVKSWPRELLYAHRLSEWVLRLQPDASESLLLAARCQHLGRWEIPRSFYPMDRPGYLRWRSELKKLHAQKSTSILRELGYPEEIIRKLQDLNLKKNLKDPEMQVLEDALCLVFLEFQLGEVAAKLSEEKTLNAIRKSWEKMSATGRQHALTLPLDGELRSIILKALA